MRIKENLYIRQIGDEYMMINNGPHGMEYSKVIHLSTSAAYLFEQSQGKDFTKEDWINLLAERYDVTSAQATADVEKLVATLKEMQVILD